MNQPDIFGQVRSSTYLIIAVLILGLTGCQSLNEQNTAQNPPSQLYQAEGFGQKLDLRGTLSIRNTSETDEIRITRVHYFNSSGKLVKNCLESKHQVLSPLASTEFGITRKDDSGGSGANFIVEWVSEKSVSDPVVEVIMITASGNQSYSFMSHGRVIKEFK